MWLHVLLFTIGFAVIVRGGDFFVDSSIGIARIARVPRVIIGCTIVSIATTSPELVVSATASLHNNPAFAIGNAVGSAIANIGLILAALVVFMPVKLKPGEFRLPGFIMMISGVLLFLFTMHSRLPRHYGFVLIAMGIAYLFFDFFRHFRSRANIEPAPKEGKEVSLLRHVLFFVIGIVMVAVGSHLLVVNGEKIAVALHVPKIIIGCTVIAIGTSLPELITAVKSAMRGVGDLSVGNIVGANILNVTIVTGTAASISPVPLSLERRYQLYNFPIMLVIMLLLFVFGWTGSRLKRWEGIVLLSVYILYLAGFALIMMWLPSHSTA